MRLVALAAGLLLALPALADEMIVPGGGLVRAEGGWADRAPPASADSATEESGALDRDGPPDNGGAPHAVRPGSSASRAGAIRDRCRSELNAYLRELLAMAGVDGVEDPLALVEGLEASGAFGAPAAGGQYRLVRAGGLPWPVDPVQPLAWSSELRRRARDVAACVHRAG